MTSDRPFRGDQSLDEALAPVRAALLARARDDAAAVLAEADRDGHLVLDTACAQADSMIADARTVGAAEASRLVEAARARSRRVVRAAELAARRDGYEELRARIAVCVSGGRYTRSTLGAVVHHVVEEAARRAR